MALAAPFPAAGLAPRRPAASSGMRLTRRGRVTLGLILVLPVLLLGLMSGAFRADAGSSLAEQGRATGIVVVQPGESLWQIAQAVAPGADPREVVTRIRELNGLTDAPIVPGQSIVVPVVDAY